MIQSGVADRRTAAAKFSDFCFVAILVWMAVPEIWTRPVAIGPVPLHFAITQLLWVSLTLEGLMWKRLSSKFLWCLLAAIVYTTIQSSLSLERNNWDLKYFVSDLWTVQIFVLGFLWARRRGFSQVAKLCRPTVGLMIPMALLTIAGLYFGLIGPGDREYSDRLYTSSLWNIGCIAQFMWPVLFAHRTTETSRTKPSVWETYLKICIALLVPTAIFIAVFTATRSLLVVSLVVYAVVRLIEPKHSTQRAVITGIVSVAVLALGLTFATVTRVKGYSVLDRFQQTTVLQEGRGIELQWLLEQLGDDYVSGWGFGSRFYSTIKYQNRPFETAPHVGIVTFALKGGLVMALTFVVVPIFMCLFSLRRRTPEVRAAVGCVLVYFTTSCLSGGWYPYQMLMFGVGVGMLSASRLRRTSPRIEFSNTRAPQQLIQV